MAVDITGLYRPRLAGWLGKTYSALLGKAVIGVGLGMIADIGSVEQQRLALPRKLLRAKPKAGSDKHLKTATLRCLAQHLKEDELAVLDAGFKLALQAAGVEHFVVRQASNCTARRNSLPAYKGRGAKPKYGAMTPPTKEQN